MTALVSFGIWGWKNGNEGWQQYVLAISIPTVLASIWGIFAVPNDPSRSGKAPIVTRGIIRLTIELGFFTLATLTLHDIQLHEIRIDEVLNYGNTS